MGVPPLADEHCVYIIMHVWEPVTCMHKIVGVPYLLKMTPQLLLILQLWREVTIPVMQGVRLGRCL